MMNKLKYAISLIFISFLALSKGAFALDVGNPEEGQRKSEACADCHEKDGNTTTENWPKIAGQPELYLVEQLKAFKQGQDGPRFEATMYNAVMALSDQDILDLAAFYSQQKVSPGVTDESLVSLGRQIYRGGIAKKQIPACSACHNANGSGNVLAKFPSLSGQNAEYVEEQLKNYRAGTRQTDVNEIMRDIALRMTDQEIEAVSSYVSGLH